MQVSKYLPSPFGDDSVIQIKNWVIDLKDAGLVDAAQAHEIESAVDDGYEASVCLSDRFPVLEKESLSSKTGDPIPVQEYSYKPSGTSARLEIAPALGCLDQNALYLSLECSESDGVAIYISSDDLPKICALLIAANKRLVDRKRAHNKILDVIASSKAGGKIERAV